MLISKLMTDAAMELTDKLATIEANRSRIEAFESLMHDLGGDHSRCGQLVESCVIHTNRKKVGLRLQLCAEGETADWIVSNIADIEARLGQRLHFFERGYAAEATMLHPTCGEIAIVVSGDARINADIQREAA